MARTLPTNIATGMSPCDFYADNPSKPLGLFEADVATTAVPLMRFQSTITLTSGTHHVVDARATCSTGGTNRINVRSVLGYHEFTGVQTTGGGWQILNGVSGLANVTGTLYGSTTFVCGLYGQVYGSGTLTEVSHMCAIWGDYNTASGVPTTGSAEILYLTCNSANTLLKSAIHIKLFPDEDCNGAESIFKFETCHFGGASGTPIRDGGTGDTTLDTGGKWLKMKVLVDTTEYWIPLMTDPAES